jgi:hypothetical protein
MIACKESETSVIKEDFSNPRFPAGLLGWDNVHDVSLCAISCCRPDFIGALRCCLYAFLQLNKELDPLPFCFAIIGLWC